MRILVKKQNSRIIKQISFVIFMLMHSSMAKMSLVVLTLCAHIITFLKDCKQCAVSSVQKELLHYKVIDALSSFISPPSWRGTVPSLQTLLWAVWHTDSKTTACNMHSSTPDSQPLWLFLLMWNQTTRFMTILTPAFIHRMCHSSSKEKGTWCICTKGQ